VTLVQHHEIGDMTLTENTGSGGRFLEVQIEFYAPWVDPSGPPLYSVAALDVRDAQQLRDAVNEWLASQGFSDGSGA
jgi:hypothetical protein